LIGGFDLSEIRPGAGMFSFSVSSQIDVLAASNRSFFA